MSIVVYRVQDAFGRGPWRPGFSHKWVEYRPDHANLLPCYIELGSVYDRAFTWEHVGCGCRSLEHLRRWFTESEYRTLLGYGYKAVAVEASRILGESATQSVFTTQRPLSQIATPVDLYDAAGPLFGEKP